MIINVLGMVHFVKKEVTTILKPLRCGSYERSWALLPFLRP